MSNLIAPSSRSSSNDYQPVDIFIQPTAPKRSIPKIITLASLLLATLIGGGYASYSLLNKPQPTQTVTKTTPQPTPQVAGLTFGDVLKQATSFEGWLAGVNKGNIELVNPDNGQKATLLTATNPWYGPISNLYWSPDKTKIAAIYLSSEDAQALTNDAVSHAKSLGLDSNITPSAFPYGLLTIIDVASRQRLDSQVVVKNSPKSVVWLDNNNQLALLNSSLQVYDIQNQALRQLTSAGNTSSQQQLASPLVWNEQQQLLYFTRTRLVGQQSAHLLSQVSLVDGTVSDISQIQLAQTEAKLFQSFDMAISSDNQRLAVINQQGLAYVALSDGAIHQLPYQDNLLWLKQVAINQLTWISDHRLAFSGTSLDGQRLWAGWDIQQNLVPAFARGNAQGSWQVASGQLAVINSQQSQLYIVNPNWSDPAQSTQEALDLNWAAVYW